jgi:hypothetical protein
MSFNRRDIGPLTRSRAAMARMSFRDIESFRRGRRAPLTGDPRQAPDRCRAASRRLGLSKISETLPLNNNATESTKPHPVRQGGTVQDPPSFP